MGAALIYFIAAVRSGHMNLMCGQLGSAHAASQLLCFAFLMAAVRSPWRQSGRVNLMCRQLGSAHAASYCMFCVYDGGSQISMVAIGSHESDVQAAWLCARCFTVTVRIVDS